MQGKYGGTQISKESWANKEIYVDRETVAEKFKFDVLVLMRHSYTSKLTDITRNCRF
jgi:hypothetical protein